MPSYLDFNTTKSLRDYLISKTLNQPNGPQTFTSTNYPIQGTSDYPDIYQGTVEDIRPSELLQTQNTNIYKPNTYFIDDTIGTLPRKANLSLYPYFVSKEHNLIGIMTSGDDTSESELYRFAAHYIKTDSNGPVLARMTQNLEASTIGRVRLIDALNGDTATALNLLTGREPLIEPNFKISVSDTLVGQAVDFVQTVAGTQLPFSTIPGDYLTDPRNPINYRPTPSTQLGAIVQDVTGAIGSLIGIQRRPKTTRKPSDLLIEHTSSGQLNRLYDLLSYSKYAPNYTTTARSQNSSKIFGFVDKIAQGFKNILGTEAPNGKAYIGDDRSDNVTNAMTDQFQRPVHSTYYLGLKFDEIQTDYFEGQRNITQGGKIAGKLTWYGINSKKNNKLGANNASYKTNQEGSFTPTLSTNTTFREGSILGVTQDILNTMPPGGQSRTHVGNVIDQTSRVFKEGQQMISRGSAIKYTDKFSGIETGVEYCRVWTKDRPYYTMNDTMKRTANIRKFDSSVLGGKSRVWNINYAPMSNGNRDFNNSSNIVKGDANNKYYGSDTFYAKKYMFSIENLAWKTSNTPGFTVDSLPACERGNNGGRVMWFPPYDLKVQESNNARWESNTFIGRPEPIYTYQNTERSGTISFKVVVDHPSVLNLLVRDYFKGMSDDEADNYINAFFAGCQDLDFYGLIQRFTTLDTNDLQMITDYLNSNNAKPEEITKYKTVIDDTVKPDPSQDQTNNQPPVNFNVILKFDNDIPDPNTKNIVSSQDYSTTYSTYSGKSTIYGIKLKNVLTGSTLTTMDITALTGSKNPLTIDVINAQEDLLNQYFIDSNNNYNNYINQLNNLKSDISGRTVQNIKINILSSCSSVATVPYNVHLSLRRSHSITQDIFKYVSKDGTTKPNIQWIDSSKVANTIEQTNFIKTYKLKDFGWSDNDGTLELEYTSYGEVYKGTVENQNCVNRDFNNTDLKIVSPIAFFCRQVSLGIKYDKLPEPKKPKEKTSQKYKVIEDGKIQIPPKTKKPTIDVMKRIIMKTLGECYYFKQLEETSPVAFSSLREKLKYFHPGFHSTTPEGLNQRLTFLHQCIRPGETLPIKGISDVSDLTARNTTFGPPPVCIVRIGDFYHSKIIIENINITYEEGGGMIWDLNPEGIGVQPMIASVTLQVKFIGGQGLEKPVERLQNALSSNFYANTEMYDERSIPTNETIGGKDTKEFTKQFLEGLQPRPNNKANPQVKNNTNITSGQYIGSVEGNVLNETKLVTDLYTNVSKYFSNYEILYNTLLVNYGPEIIPILLSPTYRTINSYDVSTPSTTTTINLFGLYGNGVTSDVLIDNLVTKMNDAINNSTDLSAIFDFSSSAFKNKQNLITSSNNILKTFLLDIVNKKIQTNLIDDKGISDFEPCRNDIIKTLDKLNFLVTYQADGKVNEKDTNGTKSLFSGFTNTDFYNEYKNVIDYISKNNSKMYVGLGSTINFNNPVINDTTLKTLFKVLLKDQKTNLLNQYKLVSNIFNNNVINDIEGNFNDFIKDQPKSTSLNFDKPVIRKNNKDLKYPFTETPITTLDGNMLNDIKSINSDQNDVINKLNFYRKK